VYGGRELIKKCYSWYGITVSFWICVSSLGTKWWKRILSITQLTFGIFGSTVSLVAMVVVSLMTSAPSAATQKMVDDSRVPAGASVIGGQK